MDITRKGFIELRTSGSALLFLHGCRHNHQVTFSAAQLQQLKAGMPVSVGSSALPADGHSHNVALTCVIV